MKLLKISDGSALFLAANGEFVTIDKITKDDLLRLVGLTLSQEVEFDDYDEGSVKNHAEQIVYENVVEKLQELSARREEFIDESERQYLEQYEKYQEELSEHKQDQ